VFGQGSATVNIAFDATTITMTGTTLQAVVLLTLGRYPSMKVKDLSSTTGIPMSALRTLFGSLCFVKDTAILKKEPKGPKIEDDSVISIEYGFKSPKRVGVHILDVRLCVVYPHP
jgi:Cullin family